MNTKNLGITALLAVLMVGIVLISGCVQKPEEQAPVTPKPNVTTPPPGEQPTERPPAEQPITDETLKEILGRGEGISSVKYDMITTAPGMPPMTQKVWLKKNKMRTEQTMTMEGQTMTIVYLIDMDAKTMYMYMPAQNTAMKMDFGKAPKSPIVSTEEEKIPEFKVIGTETIDGKVCIVYEATIEGVKTKSWVWKEKGFPIRTEVIAPEGKMITEYKNIEFVDIPDDIFKLPADVQIVEMPIGGMP